MRHTQHTKKEQGQALVEFALTVPILLLLMFGIIDFARLIFSFSHVVDASRQGVRYGIVEGLDVNLNQTLDCQGIEDTVKDTPGLVAPADMEVEVSYRRLDSDDLIVSCADGNPTAADLRDGAVLEVNVSGSIAPITPLIMVITNTINFDYTSTRAIAQRTAYNASGVWPTPLDAPQNLDSTCTAGIVSFTWNPLPYIPDRMEIIESDTGNVVHSITDATELTHAYCNDCAELGADGWGAWYIYVVKDGVGASSPYDTTESLSSCSS